MRRLVRILVIFVIVVVIIIIVLPPVGVAIMCIWKQSLQFIFPLVFLLQLPKLTSKHVDQLQKSRLGSPDLLCWRIVRAFAFSSLVLSLVGVRGGIRLVGEFRC